MANTVNYAELWREDLLEILVDNALTMPFITSNVEWLKGQTFHFTQQSVTGFKDGNRLVNGVQRGDVTQTDVPFTLSHEREIEFALHAYDIDESGGSFTPGGVTETFQRTQFAPELDAYFYSKVYTDALAAGLTSATAIAGLLTSTVYGYLKDILAETKLRRYRARGSLLMYVNSTIMNLLEQSDDLTRKIELTQVSEGGMGIETRVTWIDGVPILEVIDDERFYTEFVFTTGFVPAVGGFKLNVLVASLETVKTVVKDDTIYQFAPGEHQKGQGFLYQRFSFLDTFIMPNGSDGNIDSVWVDRDTVAVV